MGTPFYKPGREGNTMLDKIGKARTGTTNDGFKCQILKLKLEFSLLKCLETKKELV